MTRSIAVVGGGLVGLATAHAIARSDRDVRVTVFEKELGVARHQSTHNSGVLHAGLYYVPGSLKARLAVSGIRMMVEFCRQHQIAHEICGKIVVAVDESEIPRLRMLFDRGKANGLSGLRWLSPEEARAVEPNVRCVAAIHVPEEGIVDFAAVGEKLAGEVSRLGGNVLLGRHVSGLERRGAKWRISCVGGDVHECDQVIGCAGLYADRVARMSNAPTEVRIVPFRGEYYRLRTDRGHLVRHLIYPVPDPSFPFLGVHFTRLIHGGIEAGPNAVLALSREGYRKAAINLRDVIDAITFPGFWRFLARHPLPVWDEVCRSMSRQLFCRALQRLVPELREDDLEVGGAGVRAQAMTPAGNLVQDFSLIEQPGLLHVLNAPSPAATASLAIGAEIARRVVGLNVHSQVDT